MAFLNWTELVSDKVILTAGVAEMSAMTDPDGVLDYYGKIVDAYYRFGGYDPANQPPMRVYSDIQLPDAGQTALFPTANVQQYGGYPIGFLRGQSATSPVDEKKLINTTLLQAQTDGATNWFNVFFGFGEAVKSPWQESDKLLQPSLNIGYYHYAQTLGLWPGQVVNFADNVEKLNKEFARTTNNRDNGIMYGHANDNVRTTMMIQLADFLGWGIFPYVSQRARELGFEYEADELLGGQVACDFFAMSACEYADRNLLPFFLALPLLDHCHPLYEAIPRTGRGRAVLDQLRRFDGSLVRVPDPEQEHRAALFPAEIRHGRRRRQTQLVLEGCRLGLQCL